MGKVVDEQDHLIVGAKLTLHEMIYNSASYSYDTKLTGEVTTGTDGAFSFSTSAVSDDYPYGYIVAEKEGLALGFAYWRMRDSDNELQIKIRQPKELAGNVVDENNKPVSDAQVSISILIIGSIHDDRGVGGPVATELFTSITDAAGKFKFTKIPAEAAAEFIVKKEGRATVRTYKSTGMADQKLNYTAGQTDIKLVLPIEAKIEGIVIQKSTGKPVGGVKFIARSERGIGSFRHTPFASNEDGTFSINALASDRYTLRLAPSRDELADWVAEPVEVITEAGKTKSDVKIELCKGGILEVAVTEAVSKQPVEKASVNIWDARRNQLLSALSDEDGIARIRLMQGGYQISEVYKQGFTSKRRQDAITIEDGKTKHIGWQLVSLPKITGVVRDEVGKPVTGVKLKVYPSGRQNVISDAEGKYEVSRDPRIWTSRERIYCLVARHEQRNLAAVEEISEDMKRLDIKLKPGVIFSGKVVDPDSKGIAGAQVRAYVVEFSEPNGFGVPVKWSAGDGGNGHSYLAVAAPDGVTWIEANRTASLAGGYLATITSPEENDFVSKLVDNDVYWAKYSQNTNAGPWIGGYQSLGSVEPTDGWRWVTDEPLTYVNWGQGRPDNSPKASSAENCLHLLRLMTGGVSTTVWNDLPEDYVGVHGYVIEFPPGHALPKFDGINIDFDPSRAGNKMILLCFWDMYQRPSRYCVRELAKRAEELKGKGVIVVAVHTSKSDGNAIGEWVKKNDIPFPVGTIQGDVEKVRFELGRRVASLADSDGHKSTCQGGRFYSARIRCKT